MGRHRRPARYRVLDEVSIIHDSSVPIVTFNGLLYIIGLRDTRQDRDRIDETERWSICEKRDSKIIFKMPT